MTEDKDTISTYEATATAADDPIIRLLALALEAYPAGPPPPGFELLLRLLDDEEDGTQRDECPSTAVPVLPLHWLRAGTLFFEPGDALHRKAPSRHVMGPIECESWLPCSRVVRTAEWPCNDDERTSGTTTR